MSATNENSEIRLTHSLRAIAIVGLLGFAFVLGLLTAIPFELSKKGAFIFIVILMMPVGLLGTNFVSFNTLSDLKELTYKENARLIYIVNGRQKFILHAIIVYLFLTLCACLFIYLDQAEEINKIVAAITAGICVSGIYSAIVCYRESQEISRFKGRMQQRANAKAKVEALHKKTESVKPKSS